MLLDWDDATSSRTSFSFSPNLQQRAYTPPPSPCPRSARTLALGSFGILRNQSPGLVPLPARPFGYSVSDSRGACTQRLTPPRSSLTRALRTLGLSRNQIPGLVPVPARPFGYSVSDKRVACALAHSPLPSPLRLQSPQALDLCLS
jgi:hypothetical protein